MARFPRRNVAAEIHQFFEKRLPCSFCDACLAFNFEISLQEARAVAVTLAERPGFIREHAKCDACGRPTDVVSVGSRRRRR